jgi:uncharacterized protein YfaA (DUF2138 family)
MQRSHKIAGPAIAIAVVIALLAVQAIWRPFSFHGTSKPLRPHDVRLDDISRPDAIIDTASLSRPTGSTPSTATSWRPTAVR